MKSTNCPGCGKTYNGRRCRNCGYEPFPEAAGRPSPQTAPVTKKQWKQHPLIRFLLLLYLIYSLMPLLRQWGLKLEAIENMARKPDTSYQAETSAANQK